MKKAMLLFFCGFVVRGMAVCPQDIHASFLLASQNREIEAREVLHNSFSVNATDVDFISEEFVNWVAKRPSQMSDIFNKSAYYVVSKKNNY